MKLKILGVSVLLFSDFATYLQPRLLSLPKVSCLGSKSLSKTFWTSSFVRVEHIAGIS